MTRLLPAHDGIIVTPMANKPDAIHTTASDYCLTYVLPGVGPSGTLALHRLGAYCAAGETSWMIDELAATFGISPSVMRATLERLIAFGYAAPTPTGIAVPTMIPDIPRKWWERLPEYLR
jgi:hypothetical protein